MRYAVPKIEPILIAGEEITLLPTDFNFYTGGTQEYPSINSVTLLGSDKCKVDIYGTSIVLTGWKHYNSTSDADDLANGHPNTSLEDVKIGRFSFGLTMSDGVNTWDVLSTGRYYGAIYPPNISFTRLQQVIGVGSYDLSVISSHANVNVYSPSRPDKASPHSVGEFIGYCHSITGNGNIYSLTKDRAVIRKMPVIDSDTNLAAFKLRYYKGTNSNPSYEWDVNLSTLQQVTINQSLTSQAGTTDTYTVKLFRTTNASVEHLVHSRTVDVYTPLPNITNIVGTPTYDKGSVSSIQLAFSSLVEMTATVWLAYIYVDDATGKMSWSPTTGFNAVGSPTMYSVAIGANSLAVASELTVPNPSTQTILAVQGEIRNASSGEKYAFSVSLPENMPIDPNIPQ